MAVERRVGPIEVRWGRDRYTYFIVRGELVTEWKSGIDHSRSSYPLNGLSPDLVEVVGRSPRTTKTVRISLALLAASAIIFFSDYNKAIPLLAPSLLLLGVWWLANAFRMLRPRTWTEIRKLNGDSAVTLVQPEQRTDAWTHFERDLSSAIREVNGADA
jgi:hypothetical protein